jgi:hypothetical protein
MRAKKRSKHTDTGLFTKSAWAHTPSLFGKTEEGKKEIRLLRESHYGSFFAPVRVTCLGGVIGPGLLVWGPNASSCGRV